MLTPHGDATYKEGSGKQADAQIMSSEVAQAVGQLHGRQYGDVEH